MRKNQLKIQLSAIVIISFLLFSGYTSFLDNDFSKPKPKLNYIPFPSEDYLYLDEVSTTQYFFSPQGPYYIMVEIEGIDFTNFTLDNQIYEVSYGFNIFPMQAPDIQALSWGYSVIEIDYENLPYFKTLTVEPLFIAEDELEVNMHEPTEISFQAGGPISILTRPNFAYNWLYVELQNETGGSTLLKRIQPTANYPEIDPLFYCLFIERGTYIRYDLNLKPGEYTLLLKGDGLLEYKIVVNSDWDQDEISDIDEMQQEEKYDFDLDPTIPDTWGFFEKGDENLFSSQIQEENATYGFFSFYLPNSLYSTPELSIKVKSGEFKEIIIDGDATIFENEVFKSNSKSPPLIVSYGTVAPGWHHISYSHKANGTSEIEFLIDDVPIKVLKFSELRDTDGDGIKDLAEYTNGLNPSKIDSDNDGIPDNYDGSPLAKLELHPENITQIIVNTDGTRDTMVNIQIKKPENDYSTYDTPRLWRGELNVSIYPVLRMFGDIYIYDENEIEMTRDKLELFWGKDVDLLFESDENYDELGIGDPLPDDSNIEYNIIFPKACEISFDYNILIPAGHDSKSDGFLDLRFDFIWLVTCYDSWEKSVSILHFYDFDEPILVQSMGIKEISKVHYFLGNPDSFIENQILWNLVQNPELGTPEDFGVSDDIIGQGNIEYFKLPEKTAEDRENNPLGLDESEVIYIAGSYQNYDILNKIHLQTQTNPSFEAIHQGDCEAYFSSYSISNLYEGQNYFIGDPEIQGERNILYQIFHFNDLEQRANILGLPIAMEVGMNSKVLKVTQARGFNVPLIEIPVSDSELSSEIILLHQTYIERNTQNSGIPLVNFEEEVDIHKEYIDNRQDEVVLSDQFFQQTAQSQTPAELIQNYIDEYWDQFEVLNESLNQLLKNIIDITDQDLVEDLVNIITSMINKINDFQTLSYSEEYHYPEFFQFIQNIEFDITEIYDIFLDYEIQWPNHFAQITSFGEEVATFSEHFHEVLATEVNDIEVKAEPKENLKNSKSKEGSFNWGRLGQRLALGISGGVCILIGLVMVYYAVVEIASLSDELSSTEYGLRMARAWATLAAGLVLTIEGVLLVSSAFSTACAVNFAKAIKFLGYVGAALAIVIYIFELALFIQSIASGDYDSLPSLIANFILSTLGLVSCILIVFVAGAAATGIGIVIGIAVAAILIFAAIFEKKMNDPSFSLYEEATGPYLPTETRLNMKRHGGLEVGDAVNFRLGLLNDGKNPLWVRARFRLVGPHKDWVLVPSCHEECYGGYSYFRRVYEWEGEWDGWRGTWDESVGDGWFPPCDWPFVIPFSATIEEPSININYEIEIEMDYEYFSFWDALTLDPYKRKFLTHQIIDASLNMRALENTISDFYENTIEFGYESLLYKVNACIEEYRYKDAYNAVDEVIAGITAQISQQNEKPGVFGYMETPIEWYLSMEHHLHNWFNPDYYYIDFLTWDDQFGDLWLIWVSFIMNFYDSGFRAAFPFPTETVTGWRTIISAEVDPHLWRPFLLIEQYPWIMLIPKVWWENLQPQLALAMDYLDLRDSLPLKSNIKTNLEGMTIEDDAISGEANISLNLLIDGPDYYKHVDFEINPPEGFSISPTNSFVNRPLGSTIKFTFQRDSANIDMKGYYFELNIYSLEGELLYHDIVPFKFHGFSRVELETHTATEPIVPGEIFYPVILHNTGTYPEIFNVSITGTIPDSFIYKGVYPENFTANTQTLIFYPLESIVGLAIKPPRHYTTEPGFYNYTVHAFDIASGNHDFLFSDTFEVAEFYDMDFQLIDITPGDTILDYQEAIYTFNLTNLGNVDQTFQISFGDISIANGILNKNTVNLEPGGWDTFTLSLDPTSWGSLTFNINATSQFNSSLLVLNITIIDDDTTPPIFSDFEIIDTPIDVTINFKVLNEFDGDDCGLSSITIYIDGVAFTFIPDSTDTYFSFTFNDTHGGWFMELGVHEINVSVIDNDDDVPNDALSNYTLGSFETTFEDMCEYMKWRISNLNEKLQTSPDEFWRNPVDSHKKAIGEKLTALEHMFDTLVFLDAYNKLLHDIKPKLTGLKTDENENPWGNGVFHNPWVENQDFQEELLNECNELLTYVQILMSISIN